MSPVRYPRRLVQLFAGLVLFGASTALMVASDLGLASWDVLHQGLARHTGLPLGRVVIIVGALVLLAWVPLRQRPGLGTAGNVVVVGLAADATLGLLPPVPALAPRAALLLGGIALNGVATGLYVGAGLGPGPRDGLMTGLSARTGRPLRRTRTGIEAVVLAAGWLLGGTVGVGTVLFAAAIGPLAQFFITRFDLTSLEATMPRLLIITSTTRPGRTGTAVADWVLGLARDHGGFEVELADLAEIGLPFLDEPAHPSESAYLHDHTRRWSATVAAADAFLILTAEYNRGITAPLKNALDVLYAEWNGKPVGFVSYGMSSAGLRAVEMVTPVAVALGMTPLPNTVALPLRAMLDADGVLTPGERAAQNVHELLEELRRYAEALAPLRKSTGA